MFVNGVPLETIPDLRYVFFFSIRKRTVFTLNSTGLFLLLNMMSCQIFLHHCDNKFQNLPEVAVICRQVQSVAIALLPLIAVNGSL